MKEFLEKVAGVAIIVGIITTITSLYDLFHYSTKESSQKYLPIELPIMIISWFIVIGVFLYSYYNKKSNPEPDALTRRVNGISHALEELHRLDPMFRNQKGHYFMDLGLSAGTIDQPVLTENTVIDREGNTVFEYTVTIPDRAIEEYRKLSDVARIHGIYVGSPVLGTPAEKHGYTRPGETGSIQVITKIHKIEGRSCKYNADGSKPHRHLIPSIFVEISEY